eukprot:TRINITY_DN5589_c0_g1_i2.p1 TRINITY_DN5589_c0_g1~~TRINITY_DN5589_c0_g1_i2.p1  ORF type:complete len:527 (-),score=56.01 TRINITY_DN5589_c0_g1_i2:451-2031(-)
MQKVSQTSLGSMEETGSQATEPIAESGVKAVREEGLDSQACYDTEQLRRLGFPLISSLLIPLWKERIQRASNCIEQQLSDEVDVGQKNRPHAISQEIAKQHVGLMQISDEAAVLLSKVSEMIDSTSPPNTPQDTISYKLNQAYADVSQVVEDIEPLQERILGQLTDTQQQEVQHLNLLNSQIDSYADTVQDLQHKLDLAQQQINNLQDQAEKMESYQHQLEDKNEQAQRMAIQLKEMKEKEVEREQELDRAYQENGDLKELLQHKHSRSGNMTNNSGSETPDLEIEVHFLKMNNQKLILELEDLSQEFADTKKEYSRAHNALLDCRKECDMKGRQLERLRQEFMENRELPDGVEGIFKDMREEISDLQNEVVKRDSRIDQLEGNLDETAQFAKSLQQQLQAIEREGAGSADFIALQEANRYQSEQIQDLTRAYREKDVLIQDLEDKNQLLHEANIKLKEKVKDLSNASQRLLKLIEKKSISQGPIARKPTPESSGNRSSNPKQVYRSSHNASPTQKSPRSSRNSIE